MEYVIDKYKKQTDLFFLHANDSVLEFYPRFGFRSIKENLFIVGSDIPASNFSSRKLDIYNDHDYYLILESLKKRHPLTEVFGGSDYGFITMWHILNLYQKDLYYLDKDEVIIIKKEKDNVLHLLDIIFNKPFDTQLLLPEIIESDSIKLIKYYFPPDKLRYTYDKTVKEDTGLFVLGNLELGNMPFRFPKTAIT
jgi:hypothetical protein